LTFGRSYGDRALALQRIAQRRALLEAWDQANRCPRCGLAVAHDHGGEPYEPPRIPAELEPPSWSWAEERAQPDDEGSEP
jgi:hypothetical protein